jgi:hypothetical protein
MSAVKKFTTISLVVVALAVVTVVAVAFQASSRRVRAVAIKVGDARAHVERQLGRATMVTPFSPLWRTNAAAACSATRQRRGHTAATLIFARSFLGFGSGCSCLTQTTSLLSSAPRAEWFELPSHRQNHDATAHNGGRPSRLQPARRVAVVADLESLVAS